MSVVSNDGYKKAEKIRADAVTDATNIRRIGAIAIAIANATEVIRNYRKTRDLADRSLKIAEEERQHVRTVYWPYELKFLQEFGTPEEVETAEAYGRRFAGRLIPPVARAFAQAMQKTKCQASRYCSSQFVQIMQTLYQAQSTAITNAKIMGYIAGFNYAQSKKDLNDERRRQAIGIGKGLFGQAANLYKAALGSLTQGLQGSFEGLNNALEAFGYAERHTLQSVPSIEHYYPEWEGTTVGMREYGGYGFDSTRLNRNNFNLSNNASSDNPFSLTGTRLGNASAQDAVMDTSARGIQSNDDMNVWNQPYHNFATMQKEDWNEAIIGTVDSVRDGSHTYSGTDSDGDHFSITVKMSDFTGRVGTDKNWLKTNWPTGGN